MTKIISFFLSVVFAVGMFFFGLSPEKGLFITQTDIQTDYYVNGECDSLRFGVIGEGNLFAPDDEIKVVIECLDKSLDGTRARISVRSDQTGFNKRDYVCFDSDLPYNTFSFSSAENGIFTVLIKLQDASEFSFNVGVLPKNEQAGDSFFYGIQPYITRAYCWGEGFQLPNYSPEESVDRILDTAEYLGVNLVREDSVGWAAMQSEPYGELNFSVQDFLVSKVKDHSMKYNWILGYNAGKWSASEKI